jgi:hypothetical protein
MNLFIVPLRLYCRVGFQRGEIRIMKNFGLILLLIIGLLISGGCAVSNLAKANSALKAEASFVCAAPDAPCQHAQKQFEDGELSFRLPEKIVLYKNYESEPFYAVILKIFGEPCSEFGANPQIENERAQLQQLFPAQKVFAENGCGKLSAVEYDFAGKNNLKRGAASDLSFIAVYAGAGKAEAREFFEAARRDFAAAELVEMTARFRKIER